MALFPEVLEKFNPNHAPAGSPQGGQFTSGDAPFAGESERANATARRLGLSERQRAALAEYTGYGYGNINGVLRHGDAYLLRPDMSPEEARAKGYTGLLDATNAHIAALRSLLQPAPHDLVVYRGMGPDTFTDTNNGLVNRDFDYGATQGTEFVDKGFASTSSDLNEAHSYHVAIAEIHVPAGTPVLTIPNELAANPGLKDSEVLLAPGLRYRVRAVTDTEDPYMPNDRKPKLVMDVLP